MPTPPCAALAAATFCLVIASGSSAHAAPQAQPGLRWIVSDGGEGWSARSVALGDNGLLAFLEIDTSSNDRALLLSSYEPQPAQPVWSSPSPATGVEPFVHAALEADLLVSCRRMPVPGGGALRDIVVSARSSASATPAWSWTFPLRTQGFARALVSAHGTRIVAGMHDTATQNLHVAVFDGGATVPSSQWTRSAGAGISAFALSEDGSTLYVASGAVGSILDAGSGAVRHQMALPSSLPCQDISGDGSKVAVGGFNQVELWERQASGAYQRTWQGQWPGSILCHRLDLSQDGSTLVCAFGYYDHNLRVRVEAIDVATRMTTMVEEFQGAGAFQNLPSKVTTSRDGARFAIGLWGDQAGLVPELRVYQRHQAAPILVHDFAGSVLDLALSPDGERLLVGTKLGHANELVAGGSVALFNLERVDFDLRGTPSVGSSVDFDLWGAPNAPALLLFAPQPAVNPIVFPTYGTLYLRRDLIAASSMGATDAAGHATRPFLLPGGSALIGTSLWFQGATSTPRRFTHSWLRVLLLP
jgi:hypothetical protein